jgi:hypothetical protein
MTAGLKKSRCSHDRTELRKLQAYFDVRCRRVKILQRKEGLTVCSSDDKGEGREGKAGERHRRDLYDWNGDRIIENDIYISLL